MNSYLKLYTNHILPLAIFPSQQSHCHSASSNEYTVKAGLCGQGYYRYDARGRVTKMWNVIEGFDTLITEYQYNLQDQISEYSHYGSGSPRTFRNSFDYTGRLIKVEFYAGAPDTPNPEYVTHAEYSYNENSQVSQQQLNDGGVKTNYYYNYRQWISEMQQSGGLFDFQNDYYKNGNVKSQQFSGSYHDNYANTSDLSFYLSDAGLNSIFRRTNTRLKLCIILLRLIS